MNTEWCCEICNKKYKTLNGFKNHKCKASRNDKPLKVRKKKKISPHIRFNVWKTYIGNKIESTCFCCNINRITPFTYCNTFHAGHIISECNGGQITIGNLLPICSDCNSSMGIINWDEYIDKYTSFRKRIYGDDLPNIVIKSSQQIQKFYRKFIKNKKYKKPKKKKKRRRIPNYLKPTKSSINKALKKKN